MWSNEPERYAGGCVATGKVSHAEQIESVDPDQKGLGLPVGDGGVRLTNISYLKKLLCRFLIIGAGWILVVKDQEDC